MSKHCAKLPHSNTDNAESVDSDHSHVFNDRAHNRSVATTSSEAQIVDLDAQKPSDENLTGESKKENDSTLSTCRLRHGLNDDCLCEVFKFLDLFDLIQLCELDIYYQNLIAKWVIGTKLIDFTTLMPCWTTSKIFKIFGKFIRKIKIAEENTFGRFLSFQQFLSFVNQYCVVGGLTAVELSFMGPKAPQAIIDQSMPYFVNLQKLVLNGNGVHAYKNFLGGIAATATNLTHLTLNKIDVSGERFTMDQLRPHFANLRRLVLMNKSGSYGEFLIAIAANATNLTHLTLDGVDVSGVWLTNGGMQNLKEFRLHSSFDIHTCIDIKSLAFFLSTKSELEVFSYIGAHDIAEIMGQLNLTKLKAFADFHVINRAATNIDTQGVHRYAFVRQLCGVTKLGLTSYTQCGSDIYHPLIELAKQNRVETLSIYMDRRNAIVLSTNNEKRFSHRDFGHFTRLRSIELQLTHDKYENELNAEFICDFVSQLTNVQVFILISNRITKDVNKIVDMAPHLKELNISQTLFIRLPVDMRKIVRSIRKRRETLIAEGTAEPEPFHLVVNMRQWRELQVYADVNRILKTTIHDANVRELTVNGF